MKKIVSLLLIATFVLSMGVGAFAAEDPTALHGASRNGATLNEGTSMPGRNNAHGRNHMHEHDRNNHMADGPRNSRSGVQVLDDDYHHDGLYTADGYANAGDDIISIVPSVNFIREDILRIRPGEMFLVYEGRIVEPETLLVPNSEFFFDIYYNNTPADIEQDINEGLQYNETSGMGLVPLTEEAISGPLNSNYTGRLRLRSGRGTTTLSRSEIRTRGTGAARTYHLQLDTRASYNTRQTDVSFTLLTSGTLPPTTTVIPGDPDADPVIPDVTIYRGNPIQSAVSLVVGWPRMTDDDIDSYAEGDTVTITNDYPVIMRRQIERLVRNYSYRPIHLAFEDGSWEYTGRMSGMGDTNFFTTQDVVPALMNRFDQDFKFLSLPAGVTFPTNGEFRIDVSDVSDDWDRIYTYLYRNGNLTPISTNYDSLDDMIYFRTNFLGSFVMTDVEITDLNLIVQPEGPEVQEPEYPEHPETNNPPMGAPAAMGSSGLMMILSTASMLGAGAVVTRRRRK